MAAQKGKFIAEQLRKHVKEGKGEKREIEIEKEREGGREGEAKRGSERRKRCVLYCEHWHPFCLCEECSFHYEFNKREQW